MLDMTLARYADDYKKAKCYWVQILANGSFNEHWSGDINGKEYSHSRVFQISGDQFYALVTGRENAFYELYKALPLAINDYMASVEKKNTQNVNSALSEVKQEAEASERSVLDQITFENYSYYLGFDSL